MVINGHSGLDCLSLIHIWIDTCWYNPSGKIAEPALKADYDIRKLDELLPILEKSVAEIR